MKKINLIHLIITVIGIFFAYTAINVFPNLLFYIIFWFQQGLSGGGSLPDLISTFLVFSFYVIIASLVLKNSKKISNYVATKYDVYNPPILDPSRHDILYILFIGLGIYNLLQRLPVLLQNLYQAISKQNNSGLLDEASSKFSDLVPQIISVILSVILVIYAKFFADLFSDKISSDIDSDVTNDNL